MLLYTTLVSLILWEVGSSFTANNCPSKLKRDQYLAVFGEKCYYFYLKIKRDYASAEAVCQSEGGILASVKTASINQFIWDGLKQKYNFDGKAWIGLSDQNFEGSFKWRDGTELDFENFENGAGIKRSILDSAYLSQDCVVINSFGGRWTDLRCSDSLQERHQEAFVCEYNPEKSTKGTTRPPSTQNQCPSSVPKNKFLKVLDNTCYYFNLESKMEYSAAQESCERGGGSLVMIKTEKVQEFLWKQLKSTYKAQGVMWIGLRYVDMEGAFVWMDRSTVLYEKFGFGETSKLYENCVGMDAVSGDWMYYPCFDNLFQKHHEHFICEFRALYTSATELPIKKTSAKRYKSTTKAIKMKPTVTSSPTTTTTASTTTTTTPTTIATTATTLAPATTLASTRGAPTTSSSTNTVYDKQSNFPRKTTKVRTAKTATTAPRTTTTPKQTKSSPNTAAITRSSPTEEAKTAVTTATTDATTIGTTATSTTSTTSPTTANNNNNNNNNTTAALQSTSSPEPALTNTKIKTTIQESTTILPTKLKTNPATNLLMTLLTNPPTKYLNDSFSDRPTSPVNDSFTVGNIENPITDRITENFTNSYANSSIDQLNDSITILPTNQPNYPFTDQQTDQTIDSSINQFNDSITILPTNQPNDPFTDQQTDQTIDSSTGLSPLTPDTQ